MFEARLTQGAILKKVIEAMKDLVAEANLDTSEQGISMQAMDSSHVALVALSLSREAFDSYRADRPAALGLNLVSLGKILKCAGNEDIISLSADGKSDECSFKFESKSSNSVAEFTMKLMDIDSEHLGIPDTEYNAVVKLPAGDFQRIVRDLGVIGDTCTIACTKGGVTFSVSGDTGTGSMTRRQHGSADKPSEQTTIDMKEPVELTFALRYLNYFTKATPLSDSVTLSMSPDMPLQVEYPVGEGGEGYVRYYLAPKIDEDAA